MKIRNLTPKKQTLIAEELVGGRSFTISIEGHGTADLEGMYVPSLDADIFGIVVGGTLAEIVHDETLVETETPTPEEDSVDDTPQQKDDDEDEDKDDETPILSDKFICDICGAEFASDRGLSMHKSKAHPNGDDPQDDADNITTE